MTLFAELKRRRVFRTMVGYGIVAFALLQVAEPIMHGVHLPEATLSYVVVALGLGFPVVVVLAWALDVSATGIEWHPAPAVGAHSLGGTRLSLVLIGIGLLAAAPGLSWYFLRGTVRPAAVTSFVGSSGAPMIPSVAVLPFADMSPGKDQEFFSDGLAEEILNALAQVDGLHVCGRTSSFAFKGKSEDVRTIGEKLGVANVVEGSVRKEGNRIRITAQLISASDGYHVWSKTFDREMTRILEVEDEIATSVVAALKMKLLPGQQNVTKDRRASNPDVYIQYLLGQQHSHRPARGERERALEAYEKALALDPRYAPAWAGLARALFWGQPEDSSLEVLVQTSERALAAAQKAVELDPELAEGYHARGDIRNFYKWDWAGSQADFARALSLNPSHADILYSYAHLLASLGRVQEAVATKRRASEVDPLNAMVWGGLSVMYRDAGQLAAARDAAGRVLEIVPDTEWIECLVGSISLLEGKLPAALAAFDQCRWKSGRLAGVAMVQHELGHPKESQLALDALIARVSEVSAFQIAQVYAVRGEPEYAFEWLGRAYARRDPGMAEIKYDPYLRKVRDDPRYRALLKQMNLPLD